MTPAALAARRQQIAEISQRRREATHCKRGHSDWAWRKNGKRYCRRCQLDSQSRHHYMKMRKKLMKRWEIKKINHADTTLLLSWLDLGWEPFAVTVAGNRFDQTIIWLRKAND